jgi:hypothetical protein
MTVPEDNKQLSEWLKDNCGQGKLMGPYIIGLRPGIGYVIKVNDVDIPEDIFKEEYDQIVSALHSALGKMGKYFDETAGKNASIKNKEE